jgi:hypothetical protein
MVLASRSTRRVLAVSLCFPCFEAPLSAAFCFLASGSASCVLVLVAAVAQFIPNRSCASENYLAQCVRGSRYPLLSALVVTTRFHCVNRYEFVGRLMGVAIRTNNPLSLDLPSLLWKPLVRLSVRLTAHLPSTSTLVRFQVGMDLDLADLTAVDEVCMNNLNLLMDEVQLAQKVTRACFALL